MDNEPDNFDSYQQQTAEDGLVTADLEIKMETGV